MELDGNNCINFYKQVAPTGLDKEKSFSFMGVIRPIMSVCFKTWFQGTNTSHLFKYGGRHEITGP
jgi:hypothetical protein